MARTHAIDIYIAQAIATIPNPTAGLTPNLIPNPTASLTPNLIPNPTAMKRGNTIALRVRALFLPSRHRSKCYPHRIISFIASKDSYLTKGIIPRSLTPRSLQTIKVHSQPNIAYITTIYNLNSTFYYHKKQLIPL